MVAHTLLQILMFCRLFPFYDNLSELLDVKPMPTVFNGFQIIMTICIFYEIMQNCGDAEDSLDSLLIVASALISSSKLIFCHVHRDELTVNVISAIQDWSSIETLNYRNLMASYERIYKKITLVYGTAVYSCVILHCLNVLVFSPDKLIEATSNAALKTNVTQLVLKKRYPFPSTCTLNNISQTFYLIVVSNQFIQMATCCFVVIGSDALFFAITIHLCGQFEILKARFSGIGGYSIRSIAPTSREDTNALIRRHQHLLSLTGLIEAAYNKIVLIQLMMSLTFTSAAGYSFVIALKSSDTFASVKSFMVMQSLLLQSLIYSCIGEALQSAGDGIMYSVYDGSWYKLPRSLSKDLLFVMMRSNKLPRLTAGKFFDMTRATFMVVVKITFSYISALQLMIDES